MYDTCKVCNKTIRPLGVTDTGQSCFYSGKHPGFTNTASHSWLNRTQHSSMGQKCDICGSTAIDHTEAKCKINRMFNTHKASETVQRR